MYVQSPYAPAYVTVFTPTLVGVSFVVPSALNAYTHPVAIENATTDGDGAGQVDVHVGDGMEFGRTDVVRVRVDAFT